MTSCEREGCQIATTGKCLEGFEPPSTCPYLSDAQASSTEATQPEQKLFVSLSKGEALTEYLATAVAREAPTRVVILAGPHESGKTTIITSLFESFLEAPFANYLFAGSRSLIGFERRCHDAREASGRTEPHTAHTRVSDLVEFLHLRLKSAPPAEGVIQNLLISDVSGERFKALRDSADAVKEMKVLQRADHLSMVIDGSRLADPLQRHSASNDARALLRSLIEARTLMKRCRIEIVFSKWDVIVSHPEHEKILAFVADTKSILNRLLSGYAEPTFHEVAARPEGKPLQFAHGLATLLRAWLEQQELPTKKPLYLSSVDASAREFARFAVTTLKTEQLEAEYDVNWI